MKVSHYISLQDIAFHILNVDLGDIPANASVFVEQVKYGKGDLAALIFEELFADAQCPQIVILIKIFRQALIKLVGNAPYGIRCLLVISIQFLHGNSG